MKSFHIIVQKSLVAVVAVCFVFISTYIPRTPEVHAIADATEPTQILNNIELGIISAFEGMIAADTASLIFKEYVLDLAAWLAVKNIIAEITNSIVSWVNSGFHGQPMFVQDIQRYMVDISDRVYGEYVQEIGSNSSFVCEPYKLDVQVAVAQTYKQARNFDQPYHTQTCNMTAGSPTENLDHFVHGSFNEGGWDAWYQVAVQSNTYTPYGSLLAAQQEGARQILNAEKSEATLLEYGDGFISNKICDYVSSSSGVNREKCIVSTPGQVIMDTLDFQLTTGVESLIAADELDEMIASLLSQIGQMALSGTNGLLGLSGGTGYTDTGSYNGSTAVDTIVDQQKELEQNFRTENNQKIAKEVQEQLALEQIYKNKVEGYRTQLSRVNERAFNEAVDHINGTVIPEIDSVVNQIQNLITQVQNGTLTVEEAYKQYKLVEIHTEVEIQQMENRLFGLVQDKYLASMSVVRNYKQTIIAYRDALEDRGYTAQANDAQQILDEFAALEEIGTTYSIERTTNPLAGPEAAEKYFDMVDSGLYTESQIQAKIDQWDDLVNI